MQESTHYKLSFQVKRRRGATIFVTHDESEFLIKKRALKDDKFPNSDRLHDFALSHAHGMECGKEHRTTDFAISGEHIEEVIELIHSGLQENSKSHRARRPSQTRRKRSTVNMTVLEKFKEAFTGQYKETESNDTISFRRGATVYFRKTRAGPNEARIHSKYVQKFPNARKLQSYLERNNVPIDARPDYKIGPEHADQVIAILKGDG